MNQPTKPEDAPGHYGAGYGEQVPEGAPPRPAPVTDADSPLILEVEVPEALEAETVPIPAVVTETVVIVEAASEATPAATGGDDDGSQVVFTPDDVTLPPPDRPPTDAAPESEKVEMIFERS